MSEDQTTDEGEVLGLDAYQAQFVLEPCVGLTIYMEDSKGWLSWEETQQLAEFLRRHVAA